MSRDMLVRVEYGELCVVINAEGVAWSGEVARDMVNRALDGLERGLAITAAYDLEDADDDDAAP